MNPNRAPQQELGERKWGMKLIIGGMALSAVGYPLGIETLTGAGIVTTVIGVAVQIGEDKLSRRMQSQDSIN